METKRIDEIDALIDAEKEKGCPACNSLGLYHCAHPEECGVWDELIKLEKEKIRITTNMETKGEMRYLKTVCKIGQGHDCCRYIVAGVGGITCAKLTSAKVVIDQRVESGTFVAQADNCEGKEEIVNLIEL